MILVVKNCKPLKLQVKLYRKTDTRKIKKGTILPMDPIKENSMKM